jgi:hypothetical protein
MDEEEWHMIFRIATPWDYHERAELVIEAKSAEEAKAKATKWLIVQDDYEQERLARYLLTETPELVEGGVYENGGCDC